MSGSSDAMDGLSQELPEELPLSQVSLVIPSQSDEGGGGREQDTTVHVASLPDELPLSDSDDDIFNDAAMAAPSVEDTSHPENDKTVAVEEQPRPAPALEPVGGMVLPSRRRGRPNQLLMEALREAAAQQRLREGVGDGEPQQWRGALDTEVGPQSGGVEETHRDRADILPLCNLSASDKANLLKRSLAGLCPTTPMAKVLPACYEMSRLPGETVDEEIRQIAAAFLGSAPLELASKRVRADKIGVSSKKLDAAVPLLASALVVRDRLVRADIEKAIAQCVCPDSLLLYVDCCAYDETPLPVATKGEALPAQGSSAAPGPFASGSASTSAFCTLRQGSPLVAKLGTSRGAQKVLQTLQSGGLLVKHQDRFIMLLSSTLCSLSLLSSGTGVCIKEAQLRLTGVSRAATKFDQAMRVVCTDRASANIVAEKAIAAERGVAWNSLHVFCDIHRTSAAHEKTFHLVDENVRGMIHTALALQNGNAMKRFRSCMREEIASRFRVLSGAPTQEAERHKQRVLRLFVSHGARLPMRRLLLSLCPNGDWRHDMVEYYPPIGQERRTDEEYLEHVTAGVIAAVCSCQPCTYPRHRWTGADLAIDSLGIIEAVHKLLSTTFERFTSSFEHGSRARQVLTSGARASVAASRPHAADDAGDQFRGGGARPCEAQNETMTEMIIADEAAQQPSGGQERSWAEINASHRRIALTWVQSDPLAKIMLQRLVLEPLRQVLVAQFATAGDDFEQKQRSKLAQAMQDGAPVTFGSRKYRLTIAAEGGVETKCFAQIHTLFAEAAMWEIFPRTAYTVRFRSLAFRMLSRAGCVVKQLLEFPHQSFPYRLFLLLSNPGKAQELADVPECLLDGWSLDMKKRHPTFAEPEFLQKLAMVALLLWVDISQVEARHATIRRLLVGASLQTHPQVFTDLAAQWSFLQFRKRRQRFKCHRPTAKQGPQKVGAAGGVPR